MNTKTVAISISDSPEKTGQFLTIQCDFPINNSDIYNRLGYSGVLIDHVRLSNIDGIIFILPDEEYLINTIDVLKSKYGTSLTIDPRLQECYNIIKGWNREAIQEEHYNRLIPKDKTSCEIIDLRYRYGYEADMSSYACDCDNAPIVRKIANRPDTRITMQSAAHPLPQVLSALDQLNRFPLLVAVDENRTRAAERIYQIHRFAVQNNKKMAVYYRSVKDDGGIFNQYVAEHQLNHRLDDSVDIVCIQRLPKWLLEMNWLPKSTLLVKAKPNILLYSRQCDLNIYYS